MPARSRSDSEPTPIQTDDAPPAVSTCETCPGTLVFLESGNTDGWIATDTVIELHR